MEGTTLKSGPVKTKGNGLQHWKKEHMVLTSARIYFLPSAESPPVDEGVDLALVTDVTPFTSTSKHHDWRFTISVGATKYNVRVGTKEDYDGWMGQFAHVGGAAKGSSQKRRTVGKRGTIGPDEIRLMLQEAGQTVNKAPAPAPALGAELQAVWDCVGGPTVPEVVDGEYLALQSAIPVAIATALHEERCFVASMAALDTDCKKLVDQYSAECAALGGVVRQLAYHANTIHQANTRTEGAPDTSAALTAIPELIPQRLEWRQKCIGSLTALVGILEHKRQLYVDRTAAKNAHLEDLFAKQAGTEGNALNIADGNATFTGAAARLYGLHAAIEEQIRQALAAEEKQMSLRNRVPYQTLPAIEEEIIRYRALLREHQHLYGLAGEADEAWEELGRNRITLLDRQDKKDELSQQLRSMKRRQSLSLQDGVKEGSREHIGGEIKKIGKEIDELGKRQEYLRAKLLQLTHNEYPEALAYKTEAVAHLPAHLAQAAVVGNRTIDHYIEVTVDRFASQPIEASLGLLMRFEGHLCVVSKYALQNDDLREQFEKEALLPLRAPHPLVCGIEAVFEDDGVMYVQSPYYTAGTLGSYIASIPKDDAAARIDALREVFRCVLQGLAHLHSHGVEHRDLRPGNVFMKEGGTVPVLCGYGGLHGNDQAMKAIAMGTLHYLPPERRARISGALPFGSADAWAVGVMLVEARFGAWPADDNWNNPMYKSYLGPEDVLLMSVLEDLLHRTPASRPSASELLMHPFFATTLANTPLEHRCGRLDAVFSTITDRRKGAAATPPTKIVVHEASVVEDLLREFEKIDPAQLLAPMHISYAKEPSALDTSDPLTRFCHLLTEKKDLFEYQESGTVLPVPTTAESPPASMYTTVGKVLLRAIFDGRVVHTPLDGVVAHFMLGMEPASMSCEDALRMLDYYDAPAALKLRNALGTNMDHTTQMTVEKLKGVTATETAAWVVEDTKAAAVVHAVQHILVDSRRPALEGLRDGLFCVPEVADVFRALNPVDLMMVLSGPAHVSTAMVNAAIDLATSRLPEDSPVRQVIPDFLHESCEEVLRLLLHCCTGQTRLLSTLPGQRKPVRVASEGADGGMFRAAPWLRLMSLKPYTAVHDFADDFYQFLGDKVPGDVAVGAAGERPRVTMAAGGEGLGDVAIEKEEGEAAAVLFQSATQEQLRARMVAGGIADTDADAVFAAIAANVPLALLSHVLDLDDYTPDTVLPVLLGGKLGQRIAKASSEDGLRVLVNVLEKDENLFDDMLEQINEAAVPSADAAPAPRRRRSTASLSLFSETERAKLVALAQEANPGMTKDELEALFFSIAGNIALGDLLATLDLPDFDHDTVLPSLFSDDFGERVLRDAVDDHGLDEGRARDAYGAILNALRTSEESYDAMLERINDLSAVGQAEG